MYTDVFFDLDHTLWDFEKNSRETLTELFFEFGLNDIMDLDAPFFIDQYEQINKELWNDHLSGGVSREVLRYERFRRVLNAHDIFDEPLIRGVSEYYLEKSPKKKHLFPGTIKVLEQLSGRYGLHIITNGFTLVQHTKLEESKLSGFFQHIITSEVAGANKPDRLIFDYALQKASSKSSESIMVGDAFQADILGAKSAGMDQVWFNPKKVVEEGNATYEIDHLEKLLDFL